MKAGSFESVGPAEILQAYVFYLHCLTQRRTKSTSMHKLYRGKTSQRILQGYVTADEAHAETNVEEYSTYAKVIGYIANPILILVMRYKADGLDLWLRIAKRPTSA